jgi:spermidine synthase
MAEWLRLLGRITWNSMTKSLHTSIALLSATLIAFQLLLMQLFSIVQWFHFAFMVISIALLGFGASGTLIALARGKLTERAELLVPFFMILSGATLAWVVRLCQLDGIRFDSYLLFVERSQLAALALSSIVLFVPFFFGALAIGLVFVRHVEHIGSLYFANLLGSALGGAMAIGLLWLFSPQEATALLGLLPIGAGLLVSPGRVRARVVPFGLVATMVVMISVLVPLRLVPSQYKGVSRAMTLPDARIKLERHSPYGLVQVVSSSSLRFAPGLSPSYQDSVPRADAVFNNGDPIGSIIRASQDDRVHVLDYTTAGLPYAFGARSRVLVLGATTGMDVAHALSRGARTIDAVEPHDVLVSIMQNEFARETDSLFLRPEVALHVQDPRAYLRRDASTYDLILIPPLGVFGGNTGVYSFLEQYMLTKEAFREMWDHLTPDGVVSITCWLDQPPRNSLRACATIVEMVADAGISDPAGHIAAVRSWATLTFSVKRSSLTQSDTRRIREFCADRMFDPLLLPDLDPGERARFNQLSDSSLFSYIDAVMLDDRDATYEEYLFNIQPTTDDRPYFSQFLRLRGLSHLWHLYGRYGLPFLEIGSMLVVVTFLQLLVLALIFILLPLFKAVRHEKGKMWIMVYFGALGMGYMFVEMVFLQRFVLYLGHPLYAAAAVVCALLLTSGLGSMVSARIKVSQSALWKVAAVVAMILVAYGWALTWILRTAMTLPLEVKGPLAIVLIGLPGFVMGMPFPLGLRSIANRGQACIAWAWGINGCFSVVSTSLALVVAVGEGFFVVMLLAAVLYGVAAGASVVHR